MTAYCDIHEGRHIRSMYQSKTFAMYQCYNHWPLLCFYLLIRGNTCVTILQRLCVFFFWYITIRRHNDTTIVIFYTFRYDTIRRQYYTAIAFSYIPIRHNTSVTKIQRSLCVFLLIRHNKPLLVYNVYIVSSIWDVTKRRHYDTTFVLCLPSKTWQTPSLW